MSVALTAIAVILFIVFFVGIIGNAVVLFVLLRQRSTWSVTTTYLFNLALADSLFICFVPFWGHYYLSEYAWAFGLGMCKLTSVITSINMYASVFFLTAMSVDRWMAVVHATSVNLFRTSTVARWVCFLIWSAALLLSIPRLMYQVLLPFNREGDGGDPSSVALNSSDPTSATEEDSKLVDACQFYIPSNHTGKEAIMGSLEFIQCMLGFVIPMTIICICYAKIVLTVKHKVISKRVRKDRVAKLAAFIIAAFFVCWLPFHVMKFISATFGWWMDAYFNEALFTKINPFTICLAYANSCINPIVYAFTTTNFQENIKDMCGSDETRPYKMTVGRPGELDERKSPGPKKKKGESPCLNANPDPRAKVWANKEEVRQMQNVQVHPSPYEGTSSLRPGDGQTAEEQSFSYYSCPAVMQGLGKANDECSPEVDSMPPFSTPDANAYNTCDTCEA